MISATRCLKWILTTLGLMAIATVKVKVKSLSRVRLFAIPWIAAQQASPSMGFSRQEYWSGLPWVVILNSTADIVSVTSYVLDF